MAQSGFPVPAVTVVVPAYNVAPYIAEALASLQAQDWSDFEAIVVDDGSTDDTAERVAPFLTDPRFRLLRTENRGLAEARNAGIAVARAPFVSLLDGDDRYRPTYLGRMLGRLTVEPKVDFVTCDAQSFAEGSVGGEQFSRRYRQAEPISTMSLLRGETAIFGLCMIRTDLLREVGGYDRNLRAAEDLDLWLRLLGGGAIGGYVPEVLVDYRRRLGSLSQNHRLLLTSRARAFDKAADALENGEEAALARSRSAEALAIAEFEHGVDCILQGDVRSGLAAMRASRVKADSAKWSAAMSIFSFAPALARPAMAYYRRGNQVVVA